MTGMGLGSHDLGLLAVSCSQGMMGLSPILINWFVGDGGKEKL